MKYVKVLVEGYHDRAFLSGWLKSRGFVDPGQRASGARKTVINPITNEQVRGGSYAWESPDATTFVEIVPAGGTELLAKVLPALIRRAPHHDPDELLVVLDVDDEDAATGAARRRQALAGVLAEFSPTLSADGSYTLGSGLVARLLLWMSGEPTHVGAPRVHALERVVCDALSRVYPQRAEAVAKWLSERPDIPPSESAKAHTWSFMAGWYADRGCDAFLRTLWDNPETASALADILRKVGAEEVIAAALAPDGRAWAP